MVPIALVRAALGLLTVFFAHYLGRAAVRTARGVQAPSRLAPWMIRFVLALGAILWSGGLDAVTIATLALAGATGGYGAWRELHPKPPEDLVGKMFPRDPSQD
ncbi:MAG: hypothetical protein ACP5U2_04840 [Bryobacteraceae bacterium]